VSAGGRIAFACGAAPATITLSSVLRYTTDVDLEGAGRVTLSGGNTTRLFVGSAGATLTLRHLTLRDGYFNAATAGAEPQGAGAIHTSFRGGIVTDSVAFIHNVSAGDNGERGGGAVSTHESPRAVFFNTVFQDNSGHLGSAVNNLLSDLELVNSSVVDNRLDDLGFGGAIYVDGAARTYSDPTHPDTSPHQGKGTIRVCGSLIARNTGGTSGGGLYACGYDDDNAILDRSAVIGNATGGAGQNTHGGGVSADCNGRMTVTQSLIADNTVGLYGGGVWQTTAGAAASNPLNRLTLRDSTLVNNRATADNSVGGGLWVEGRGEFRNVTIASNSAFYGGGVAGADKVTAFNTIVSGNHATNPYGVQHSCGARFAAGSAHLLEWPQRTNPGDPNNPPCADDALVADPALASLASNGGPTSSMALGASSPARGAGASCEVSDQRGVARGARCDLGATQLP
jgi:hypothetical protein